MIWDLGILLNSIDLVLIFFFRYLLISQEIIYFSYLLD